MDARLPIFAVHPDRWEGSVELIELGLDDMPVDRLHTVQLLYTSTGGTVLISNIAAREVVGPYARHADRMVTHLETFVRRCAGMSLSRLRRRVVRTADFDQRTRLMAMAGAERAVNWLRHRRFPLEVVDAAIADGRVVCELVVAGWGEPILDLASQVEPVTPALAAVIDAVS